jgi:hypothetical protein
MAYSKLRNCFLKAARSTDESVLSEIQKASVRALGLLKIQGKALIDIFWMAEHAQSVMELTSTFDSMNQVMLLFLSDVQGHNRFIFKRWLEDLGVTPSFARSLQRATSLREAIEQWKTEIMVELSRKMESRAREQLLSENFDRELTERFFSRQKPQTTSLKRYRSRSPLNEKQNPGHRYHLDSVVSPKRRRKHTHRRSQNYHHER